MVFLVLTVVKVTRLGEGDCELGELRALGVVDCSCPSTEPEILGIFPLNQSSIVSMWLALMIQRSK